MRIIRTSIQFYSLVKICVFSSFISIYFYWHITQPTTDKSKLHPKNHENTSYFADKNNNDLPPLNRIKINSVIIRGERHSGTGFLRTIINKNCPEMTSKIKCEDYRGDWVKNCNGTAFTKGQKNGLSNQTDPWLHNLGINDKYDWKHSILKPETVLDPEDLMIVIFRNYSTWLPKMRETPYEEQIPVENLPMQAFLRSEWKNPLTRTDHSRKDPGYYMLDSQHWKNVFEMRTTKYTNWLEYTKRHPLSSIAVKYENMAANSTDFLKSLLKKYDMPCKPVSEWDPVECHAKWGKCVGNKHAGVSGCLNNKCPVYQVETKTMAFIDSKYLLNQFKVIKYADEEYEWKQLDWDFVLANLDTDLERKIGYF